MCKEKMMDYFELLQHYKSDLSDDCDLVEEAIVTLESYFDLLDKESLLHHSRPLAIAYLALKSVEDGK